MFLKRFSGLFSGNFQLLFHVFSVNRFCISSNPGTNKVWIMISRNSWTAEEKRFICTKDQKSCKQCSVASFIAQTMQTMFNWTKSDRNSMHINPSLKGMFFLNTCFQGAKRREAKADSVKRNPWYQRRYRSMKKTFIPQKNPWLSPFQELSITFNIDFFEALLWFHGGLKIVFFLGTLFYDIMFAQRDPDCYDRTFLLTRCHPAHLLCLFKECLVLDKRNCRAFGWKFIILSTAIMAKI